MAKYRVGAARLILIEGMTLTTAELSFLEGSFKWLKHIALLECRRSESKLLFL